MSHKQQRSFAINAPTQTPDINPGQPSANPGQPIQNAFPEDKNPEAVGPEGETNKKETPATQEEIFLETLSEDEKELYIEIKEKLKSNSNILLFMLDGELSYDFSIKNIPVTIRLLTAREKELTDSYNLGEDPFGLFEEEINHEIEKRMKIYNESRHIAFKNYMAGLSIPQVSKRFILAVLAVAIKSLNGNPNNDIKAMCNKLKNIQYQLIHKLNRFYIILSEAVAQLLNDKEFLKN